MLKYTKQEDRLNTLTHLVGLAIFSLMVLPIIGQALAQGDWLRAFAFTVYYLGVGAMFLSSSLYHGTQEPKRRTFFRVLDHSAIPICIAASYTPIVLLAMEGTGSRLILIAEWVLALVCVAIQLYYGLEDRPVWVSRLTLIIYLLMGWMAILMIRPIVRQLSWDFIKYVLAGGIFYTVGVVFYKWDRIPYNHAIWHVFIILGTFAIFAGIYKYIV